MEENFLYIKHIKTLFSVFVEYFPIIASTAAGIFSFYNGRKIHTIQAKLNSQNSHSTNMNNLRISIIPEIWGKISHAYFHIYTATSALKSYKNISLLQENEIRIELQQIDFSEHDILFVINSLDRQEAYEKIVEFKRIQYVYTSISNAIEFGESKSILFDDDLMKKIENVLSIFKKAAVDYEIGIQMGERSLILNAWGTVRNELGPAYTALRSAFREEIKAPFHGQRE